MADLTRRGISFEYEPVPFVMWLPLRGVKCDACGEFANATKRSEYTVDLLLGNGRYVELKGKLGVDERRRLKGLMAAWVAANLVKKFPQPLSVLFQKDNWTTARHKERYSTWAKKAGFEVAVGTIPEGWVK